MRVQILLIIILTIIHYYLLVYTLAYVLWKAFKRVWLIRERRQNSPSHSEEAFALEEREGVLTYTKNGHPSVCNLHFKITFCMEVVAQITCFVLKICFVSSALQFVCINFSTLSWNQDLLSATTTPSNCFDKPAAWCIRVTLVLRLVVTFDYLFFFLYHFSYFTEDILVCWVCFWFWFCPWKNKLCQPKFSVRCW